MVRNVCRCLDFVTDQQERVEMEDEILIHSRRHEGNSQ